MNITDFLAIGIVGAFLALIIQAIKSKFGLDSVKTKIITITLAIVFGSAYYFLSQTIWWQSILGVLAAASTVWAYILKTPSN